MEIERVLERQGHSVDFSCSYLYAVLTKVREREYMCMESRQSLYVHLRKRER